MMRKIEKREKAKGGEGYALFEHLLEKDQMGEACSLYAKVTLPPGSSIGYHVHQGDSESYYFLSGEGTYLNNDKEEVPVRTGDVTFTGDGEGHGLINTGKEKMVFMALILKSTKEQAE